MMLLEDMDSWRERAHGALAGIGVDLYGVADGRPYQQLLPDCRAVVVFGNGGSALWDSMVEAIGRDPGRLTTTEHPLDDHVQRAIDAADPRPPGDRRWIRCAATETVMVDFRSLAVAAGLGHPSRMGLLIHPRSGLWTGLRAACFTTEELPITGPLPGAGPCDGCPAPCAEACPGGAFVDGDWDPGRCAAFHVESETCRGSCASRRACPVGAEHAYGPEQELYHSWRPAGRVALATRLGIHDRGTTEPLAWRRWAKPVPPGDPT